jgi:predicted dienelactone hydrolase
VTSTTAAAPGPCFWSTADRTLTGDGPHLVVRVWSPLEDGTGPRPLIVLAHGLNGEPDKFDVLSGAWANAGYVVAAPRFPGSSASGGGRVDEFESQPADVSSVIDQLLADPSLRIDPAHIAVAGLSLGGSTIYALTTDPCCIDPRIKGAAIFDGLRPGPFGGEALVPSRVPVLITHCDRDPVLSYESQAARGYERMGHPTWLVTMPCTEHAQPYEDDRSAFDGLVEQLTLDLWASVLRDDPQAGGGIASDVHEDGRARVQGK